jgi:hypothetical protein
MHDRPTNDDVSTRLLLVTVVAGVALILAGVLAYVVDAQFRLQALPLWRQVCTVAGACFLIAACGVPILTRLQKGFALFGALLLLLTFIDSLDGHQALFTSHTVLLFTWACVFAGTTSHIGTSHPNRTTRHVVAMGLGSLAAVTYLGFGVFHLLHPNDTSIFRADRNDVFLAALIISFVIQFVGGVGAYQPGLRGLIRVCPACGLPNIRERRTCKRCQTVLGPITRI